MGGKIIMFKRKLKNLKLKEVILKKKNGFGYTTEVLVIIAAILVVGGLLIAGGVIKPNDIAQAMLSGLQKAINAVTSKFTF